MGANGIGKTTLLRLLVGIEEPSAGTIRKARRLSIGYLPQEAVLEGEHTLWEECLLAVTELRIMEKNIEKAISAFSLGQIQDSLALYKHIKKNGFSIQDLQDWVKGRYRKIDKKNPTKPAARPASCPECGFPMIVQPAGEDPEDGSHWTCPKCRFGKYDPRPVSIIITT